MRVSERELARVARANSVEVCAWVGDATLNEVVRLLPMTIGVASLGEVGLQRTVEEKSQSRNAQRAVSFRRVSSVRALRRARREGIERLLIDLGERGIGGSQAPSSDLMRSLERWKRGHIVMICRPVYECLRVVHVISSVVPSELHLLGVDSAEALRQALGIDPYDEREVSAEDVLTACANWPRSVRDAVTRAVAAPVEWPVKRIAAHAGISRRTLERYFDEAGLPGPAEALRVGGPSSRP